MNLGELISELKKLPSDTVFGEGFDDAFSYRGDYYDLALRPALNVSVNQMLTVAESAIGATFTGYKGGDYTMDSGTSVHIAAWGSYNGSEDALTSWRWKHMLSTVRSASNA